MHLPFSVINSLLGSLPLAGKTLLGVGDLYPSISFKIEAIVTFSGIKCCATNALNINAFFIGS